MKHRNRTEFQATYFDGNILPPELVYDDNRHGRMDVSLTHCPIET